MVIDEGSNAFIQNHWEELLKEEKFSVKYVLPARQTYYNFKIKKFEEKPKSVKFVLYPSNPLIRLLAGNIYITFSRKDKKLLMYEGITNLRDQDDNISVRGVCTY